MIEMPGINISPTIYLEEYYESYVAGRKIEQIVDDIKQLYEEIKQEKPWDCESFRDYEGVRNRIVFKVINTAKNRKFLRTVPHLAFLDLSIVFMFLLMCLKKEQRQWLLTEAMQTLGRCRQKHCGKTR
mgnify:FL=1